MFETGNILGGHGWHHEERTVRLKDLSGELRSQTARCWNTAGYQTDVCQPKLFVIGCEVLDIMLEDLSDALCLHVHLGIKRDVCSGTNSAEIGIWGLGEKSIVLTTADFFFIYFNIFGPWSLKGVAYANYISKLLSIVFAKSTRINWIIWNWMYHNGNNMTISVAVVQCAKSRTRIVEEGSSNLAMSSFLFFFSEEYFLCTDMTENSTKAWKCLFFCTVVHMYTWSTHTVASKSRLFRLRAKNVVQHIWFTSTCSVFMCSLTFTIHNSQERKTHFMLSWVFSTYKPFLYRKKSKTLLVRFDRTLYLLYVTSPAPNPLHYSGRLCSVITYSIPNNLISSRIFSENYG